MPQVDPDDDTIWRWVIHHCRFDPIGKKRRDIVVAAYDNASEFNAEMDRYAEAVRAETVGQLGGHHEYFDSVTMHPGYLAEQARAQAVRRAMEQGVSPRALLQEGPLPSNVGYFGVDEDGHSFSFGGGEPPRPPASEDATE